MRLYAERSTPADDARSLHWKSECSGNSQHSFNAADPSAPSSPRHHGGAVDEISEDARHILLEQHPPVLRVQHQGEQLERLRERYVEAFDASLVLRAHTKSDKTNDVTSPSPEDLANLTL